MRNLFGLLGSSALALSLAACGLGNGSSAPPPPWDSATGGATAGDGRVKLDWTPTSGVSYWLFMASDESLTAFNWISLANAHAFINATSPYYVCGLYNGTRYYFATNGRIDGGPGGASSPPISAVPYNASSAWHAGSSALTGDIFGVGYTGLTTCANTTTSAAGSFAAVGKGGSIYTSSDGKNWVPPATAPSGLPDLYAVRGYAANQNNLANPAMRWVAVGAGGVSIYSTDGSNWQIGRADLGNPALRSLTQVTGTFFAVGDSGTIVSSADGITWTTRTSNTSAPLYGVYHGIIYVAVGDSGTILLSADGNTWVKQTIVPTLTTNTLRQVATYGNIIVAVGDSGTIVTSIDNGSSWSLASLPGAIVPNLVGVSAESQLTANATVDAHLGYVSTAQFVAIDSAGNAYTSVNGYEWSPAIATGAANLNTLVSSGFGYVAAGNNGATAYAF